MKNLSLNHKISVVVGIFVFGLITVSLIGLRGLGSMDNAISGVINGNVPRIINSNNVRGSFRGAAITLLNFILEENVETRQKLMTKMEEDHTAFLALFEKAVAEASEKARPKYAEVKEYYLKWWDASSKIKAARMSNESLPTVMGLYRGNIALRGEAEKILADLVKMNMEILETTKQDAIDLYKASFWIMVCVSLFITIAASLLAFAVLSATSKRINAVIDALKAGSSQVSSAAQEIASSSEELSQASTEQAASLEQTAASIEQMNSIIQKNAENATAAAKTSNESQQSVNEGKSVVQQMIESMDAINKNSERMSEIVKVIEDIGAKTKVINDIVFQTKLLSFNASVEAARAGEHGKGFAVVAEEVGNLAQMSGNAAQEISSLLESSTDKVQKIIEETKANVATGAGVARQCGEVFESVVHNVEKVTGMATEISSASEEQSKGCTEVTKAMAQVDQATQQNAATSEQCASASEELAAQAEILENTVTDLVATVHGANAVSKEEKAPKQTKATKKSASSNVVAFKPKKESALTLKAASGDTPAYNHPNFEEV